MADSDAPDSDAPDSDAPDSDWPDSDWPQCSSDKRGIMSKSDAAMTKQHTVDTPDTPEHHPDWRQSRWRSNVRRKLLDWFSSHARQMPWRSDPTPYRVWVSEIMLQQTQVATVLPYYERWMRRYPTVAALAEADESDLMRLWEGLGYYRRVKSMAAAARRIMEEFGGEFPLDYQQCLSLPGIGRYTAGAVLSISNDARLPVLEGNTLRVYSRLIALRVTPTEKPANDLLWNVAEAMLPRTGSGQFNQAAMELGALVCSPKQPDCDNCPVMRHCHTAHLGLQAEIPGKIKKIRYEDRTEIAFVIRRSSDFEQRFLARRLPDGGRWAGLWDFPRATDGMVTTIDQAGRWLSEQLGIQVNPGTRLLTHRHAVTKYRIRLHVHEASLRDNNARQIGRIPEQWQWVTLDDLGELPLSVTGRRIVEFLSSNSQGVLPLD